MFVMRSEMIATALQRGIAMFAPSVPDASAS
jgi:hypothetical protein